MIFSDGAPNGVLQPDGVGALQPFQVVEAAAADDADLRVFHVVSSLAGKSPELSFRECPGQP